MPPIDKEAMRAQTQAALGAAPAAPAAPAQPAQSIAQRAATQVAQASAAAATGQPGLAAATQPSQPGAPGGAPSVTKSRLDRIREVSEDRFPVKFNHETVELPVSEVQRFAQLGMASEDIQKQRSDLKADQRGYEGYKAFQRWVEQDTSGTRARALQDAFVGRVDFGSLYRKDEGDDQLGNTSRDGDTRGHTSQGDPALQARLNRLEQQLAGFSQQADARSLDQRIEAALTTHDYLKGDADAIGIARDIVNGRLGSGEFQSIEAEVARAASRVKSIAEGRLEAIRAQREQQAQEFVPVTPTRGPAFPKLPDGLVSGTKGMRSQQNKQTVKDWLASFGRAAASGPQ